MFRSLTRTIDRVMSADLTATSKLIVLLLKRHYNLTAIDISEMTRISARAVYYALDTLIARRAVQKNAGVYNLTTDYMQCICKKRNSARNNARARKTEKSVDNTD